MEILPFNTTCMDLLGTMLNEISHAEKEKYNRIQKNRTQNRVGGGEQGKWVKGVKKCKLAEKN